MNLTDKEFDWITTGLALLSLKPKLHGDSAGVMDLYSRLVVDRKAPPVEAEPVWRSPIFTVSEQATMIENKMDEIRDCIKDMACNDLDGESLVDLIAYLPIDLEVLAECLKAIKDGDVYLDELSSESPDHGEAAKAIRRFSMVDGNNNLTPFGEEVLKRYA